MLPGQIETTCPGVHSKIGLAAHRDRYEGMAAGIAPKPLQRKPFSLAGPANRVGVAARSNPRLPKTSAAGDGLALRKSESGIRARKLTFRLAGALLLDG